MNASVDLDKRRRLAQEAVREASRAGVEQVTLADKPLATASVAPADTAPVVAPAAPPTAPEPLPAAVAPPSPISRTPPAAPPPIAVGYVPRRSTGFQAEKGSERLAPSGADLVPLTVMIPDYLLRQVEQAIASNQGISKRFVVTDALSRAGFMVKPEDMVEDGRRRRRRKA